MFAFCTLALVESLTPMFGFWYFGHFSFVIFFPFFCLAHLALLNINKDYVIHIFVNSWPKVTKNEKWDERNIRADDVASIDVLNYI